MLPPPPGPQTQQQWFPITAPSGTWYTIAPAAGQQIAQPPRPATSTPNISGCSFPNLSDCSLLMTPQMTTVSPAAGVSNQGGDVVDLITPYEL